MGPDLFARLQVDRCLLSVIDPQFLAGRLRRTIQRRVDNELANMVLSCSLTAGVRVVVGAGEEAGGGLTFDIVGAVEAPGDGRRET